MCQLFAGQGAKRNATLTHAGMAPAHQTHKLHCSTGRINRKNTSGSFSELWPHSWVCRVGFRMFHKGRCASFGANLTTLLVFVFFLKLAHLFINCLRVIQILKMNFNVELKCVCSFKELLISFLIQQKLQFFYGLSQRSPKIAGQVL